MIFESIAVFANIKAVQSCRLEYDLQKTRRFKAYANEDEDDERDRFRGG